ncbi:MAG TPA: MBOAT family protein [Polyangia bacterium]|nr:MBOAT family protein [Polyangia bacterium]
MLFNSLAFLIFFPLVTLIFFLLPHRWRWVHLLAASCYFYASFVPIYLLILAFTIAVDYVAGLLIERAQGQRRKLFLACSIVANVGVLCVFKYWNFVNHNLTTALQLFGVRNAVPMLSFVLPLGLSFHTFQAMSYTIEVYRGHQKAERHLGIYALYVMFYPQLVAGPIERPQNMLPQFRVHQTYDPARVAEGLKTMAWGMFKKLVLADNLSIVVAPVYAHPRAYSGVQLAVATVCFAFQIYCDFSGYSDIALGSARVMGFKLMTNFDAPYESTSVTEFWRRWHISLSTWFKDYLYFPLGGNRRGAARGMLNKMIVFVVSGLWHGANWTYVVWGGLHGVYTVGEQLIQRPVSRRGEPVRASWARRVVAAGVTFTLVCLAWVFFRAERVGDAWQIVTRILTFASPSELRADAGALDHRVAFLALAPVVMALEAIDRRGGLFQRIDRLPALSRYAVYLVLVYATILFRGMSAQFIYFQF